MSEYPSVKLIIVCFKSILKLSNLMPLSLVLDYVLFFVKFWVKGIKSQTYNLHLGTKLP